MSKYSIVLPVHNGGEYIKECISSILAQNYADFNLLVLENASTDGTFEWLKTIKDNRLIIIPSSKFLSMRENWLRIKEVSKNEFFTLVGYDDLLDVNYLNVMDKLIKDHPDASLYQAHFRYIDSLGNFNRSCHPMTEIQYSHEILAYQFKFTLDSMGTGFMMRELDFNRVGGHPPYPNLMFADNELLFKLANISYKVTSLEECFSYREHDSISVMTNNHDFQEAFFEYLAFIKKQALFSENTRMVVNRYSHEYLKVICKGLIYKELLTSKKTKKRSVKKIIDNFQKISNELTPDITTDLKNDLIIKVYLFLDRIYFSRVILNSLLVIKSKIKIMILRSN